MAAGLRGWAAGHAAAWWRRRRGGGGVRRGSWRACEPILAVTPAEAGSAAIASAYARRVHACSTSWKLIWPPWSGSASSVRKTLGLGLGLG